MRKRLNLIITAAVCLAVMFASCTKEGREGKQGERGERGEQGPAGPTNTFSVTFDYDNGNPNVTQTVLGGSWARKPETPEKLPPGLYLGKEPEYRFEGWYQDGAATPFDFDSPITANISLKARWTNVFLSTPVAGVAENNVAAAVAYVNGTPGVYTLVLGADVEISNTQTLNVNNVQLTIVGSGKERSISYNANQSSTQLFLINANGTTLTLGKNITLKPKGVGLTTAVKVTNNNSHLVMLDGSKITGFSDVAVRLGEDSGSGSNSSFTMEGGEITGNTTNSTGHSAVGGVFVQGGTTFNMSGGRVSGNFSRYNSSTSNTPADVFIDASSAASKITLSNNAVIGNLLLTIYSSTQLSILTIGNAYSGEVSKLHLLGNAATWANNTVIRAGTGYTLTANDIAKFGLGEFRVGNTTQPISNTHQINASGVLVAKP